MPTQTIEFSAPPNQTINTVRLFAAGSDTIVATSTATERTNAKTVYVSDFTNLTPGLYRVIALNSDNLAVANWWVRTNNQTGVYLAYENPDAGSYTEERAEFLDGVLLANNYNERIVLVTGSKHIAASIHDSEPDSIPEDAFVTGAFSARVVGPNAIDAEALAADAVAEIRNGFGLASGNLDTQLSNIQSDTNDIQNRIPATLVDGRMSSHTGSISAGPVSEIQNGLAEQSTLLAVAGYVDTEMAAVKSVTDKLNTGLTQDGNVWQFTANMLELAPLSGDATLANQQTILTELDEIKTKTDLIGNAQAVTSLLAGAVLSPGTIVGFPEVLTVGDSYTISNGRAITVPVVDEDGNPIAQSGSLLFSNADVTFVIKRASDTESNRVLTCTATFVDPPGTGTGEAPYALIEIPAEETAKGLPKYQYSGILKFTWPGTADEVISFETSTITFDN